MRSGTNRTQALSLALANAKTDDKPRYVWMWDGVYWVEREPPKAAWAGTNLETVTVVNPEGTTETFDPQKHGEKQC